MFDISKFKASTVFSIQNIQGDVATKARLQEMGFTPGQQIEYCGRAPFTGPAMFRLGTMVIALRETELACLELEKVTK